MKTTHKEKLYLNEHDKKQLGVETRGESVEDIGNVD